VRIQELFDISNKTDRIAQQVPRYRPPPAHYQTAMKGLVPVSFLVNVSVIV
jgi:hypothetical protein